MYGGTIDCFGLQSWEQLTGMVPNPALLLPGWQQPGAAGVLLNGLPIAGAMQLGERDSPHQSRIISILGTPAPPFHSRVRVTGNLVLDCGHGFFHFCHENDPGNQRQEIHPIWALDVVQNFQTWRPYANLTGVWSSDDQGTYYVRQLGSTVWWLGLSVDEGQSFANVFRGTLQNGQISGNWADIPLGGTANSGPMNIAGTSTGTSLTRVGAAGAFSGDSWEKLRDVLALNVVVFFEGAEINGAWPNIPDVLEFRVGPQKVKAEPRNPHPVSSPDGRRVTRADLGARIPVTVSRTAPLPMAASFAEYRAIWSMSPSDLTPGEHTQILMPAAADPTVDLEASEGKDRYGRTIEVRRRNANTPPPPPITIRYRIEETGAAH